MFQIHVWAVGYFFLLAFCGKRPEAGYGKQGRVPLWDGGDICSGAWPDRWLASRVPSHPSAALLTAEWHSVTPVHSASWYLSHCFITWGRTLPTGLGKRTQHQSQRRCARPVPLMRKREGERGRGEEELRKWSGPKRMDSASSQRSRLLLRLLFLANIC